MADGRFVSKAISHDWALNRSVSLHADYLYARCIPHLDREGRLPGHPGEVKAIAVPIREDMTPEVVDRCLGELATAGLVLWYEVEGRPVLWFKGFLRHNKYARLEREAVSKLPPPTHPALQRLSSIVRTKSDEDGGLPPEVKGSEQEVKRSEVKKSLPAVCKTPRMSREQQAIEDLVAYLGEESRTTLLALAAMPDTGSAWAQGFLATWGPSGSMEGNRVPADMRAEVVALATQRYVTDRQRWYGRGFAPFVSRAHSDILAHRVAERKDAELHAKSTATADMKAREADEIARLNERASSTGPPGDPMALVRNLSDRFNPKTQGSSA